MKIIDVVINGNQVKITFDENSIHIFNGYQIKEELKMRGYRFNPEKKTWYINPDDVENELKVLNNDLVDNSYNNIKVQVPVTPSNAGKDKDLPDSYSVMELRHKIEEVVRGGIQGSVWIRGLIASEIKNYNWFSYFDLRDEDENLNIFFNVEVKKGNLEMISEKLVLSGVSDRFEKDLPVFCLVNLKISSKNQIDVRLELLDILPEYTRSKLKSKLDITIEKLKDEKLFELQKSLVLPRLIKNIALVTSEQGTSIKDILAGLHPYENQYNIFFVDSRMEGENAIGSVVNSIEFIENYQPVNFDLIVIARGGGSEQSLSIFNSYEICKKVCLSKIPVITAIGHEKDLSAIELCSYITPTPSTPSGIGKYLGQKFVEESNLLGEMVYKITSKFSIFHQGEMEKVNAFLSHVPAVITLTLRSARDRLVFKLKEFEDFVLYSLEQSGTLIKFYKDSIFNKTSGILKVEKDRLTEIKSNILNKAKTRNNFEIAIFYRSLQRIDLSALNRENLVLKTNVINKTSEMINAGKKIFEIEMGKISMMNDLSEANNPERIMEKGFTMTLDENNNLLKSLELFRMSEQKKLRFFDGETFIEEKEEK